MELAGQTRRAPTQLRTGESFDVIVIGGGQAGLSVGYHLAQRGVRFVILDANERIGDTWRKRWDSLRLFTPAKFDGLVGMRFPAPRNSFPTKDEMADYLEAYAARFGFRCAAGCASRRLFKRGARYRGQGRGSRAGGRPGRGGDGELSARKAARLRRVRFPAGSFRCTRTTIETWRSSSPGASSSSAPATREPSSRWRRRAAVTRRGSSGRDIGHVPFRPAGFFGRNLLGPLLLRFVFHRLLTVRTPLGRKARPKMLGKAAPLIRVKPRTSRRQASSGSPRVVGVRDGRPLLEDGRVLDVANVIWCSGFHPGFDWIDLPVFGDNGELLHQGGVVESQPGTVLRRPDLPVCDVIVAISARPSTWTGCSASIPTGAGRIRLDRRCSDSQRLQ